VKQSIHPRAFAALACAAALCVASAGHAEKADKGKNINFTADQVDANYEHKTATLKGNVVLTQGTMIVRGDRIDFQQNPDNSVSAKVWGNPLSFRQKKDDSNEYFEGYAQRADYDGTKELLQLYDRALLRDGQNEIRSNHITYNSVSGKFTAEGGPEKPGATQAPGGRVSGVFTPNDKDQAAPGAKGAPAPKAGSKADKKAPAPPLKLTPDSTIKQ
jgi:lipopolysaccharide export system protein LptA